MTFSLTGTSAPCVVKVGKIAEIWGNMWRIFTFLVPLTTSASIALRIFQQGTVWIFIFPKIASRKIYLLFFSTDWWLQDSVRTISSMITLSKMALFCTDVHSVEKVPVIEAILGSMLITFIFPVHSLTLANAVVRITPQETCWTCTFQNSIEIYNSWLQVETSSFTIT